MATTATPRRRGKPAGTIAATPAQMHALKADIKLQEREQEKQVLLVGALAAVNIHQNGGPGTGKSLLCREFCKRIGVGGEQLNHFEKTLHPQMPADALMGAYDIEKLLGESRLERKIEGYLPNAHTAFLDELTRANGPVCDALLPLMNTTERLYEANGHMARAPMLFLVTAANFLPDPTDPQLGAFVSRITLMCDVSSIKAEASFLAMIDHEEARRRGEPTAQPQAFVTLEGFKAAQQEVRLVRATDPDFRAELWKLTRAVASAGLGVDDRRWSELLDVARANAWLCGRDVLVPEDLAALESGLWRLPTDKPTVAKLLQPYRSTFEQKATERREEAQEALETHAKLRPIVEGTPPTQHLDRAVLDQMTEVGRTLKVVYARIEADIDAAVKQNRDASALRDLLAELEDVRVWRENNEFPAKW